MKAVIFDIQRFCLHDGKGIRTTVFFKGCPLNCKWCHNPESKNRIKQLMFFSNLCIGCGQCVNICTARKLNGKIKINRTKCVLCGKCVKVCKEKANKFAGYEIDTSEIFGTVMKDYDYYENLGGMTLSGGEPSLQGEAVYELLDLAKEKGINCVIETCGFGDREFYCIANNKGAVFYYDIKAIDREKHRELTGQYNDRIIGNLEYLFSVNARVVLRLPLIPEFNDSDEDLLLLKNFLSEHKEKYIRAEIMKYHILGKSKANALGYEYDCPSENAGTEQIERWLKLLDSENNKVFCD